MKTNFDASKRRWRVSFQSGTKQHRKFFPTEALAKEFIATRTADVKEFGVRWASLTPMERAEIQLQLDRLRRLGWPNLREAVDHLAAQGKRGPALPLEAVARQYLVAKQAAALRPRSLARIRVHLERFLTGRRETPISDVTPADIREFLGCNGWAPRTARGHLGDLESFYSWAIRNGCAKENPAAAVDKPRLEDKPPGILTVPQCAALLNVCRSAKPALLPTLVLCLLAGVRPQEARRLDWANVGAEAIEIPGAKSKTRRRRPVPITPQLRAWIDVSRAEGGALPAANFVNLFGRVRRLAGLAENWPHDAMRHSFASYHLAKHRNEYRTALEMGTSPQMLFAHYRELVSTADAEAFFAILPSTKPAAAAIAENAPAGAGLEVKADPSRPPNRGNRNVTKDALGAVFGHGSRRLTPAQARAVLIDVHGLAPSTVDAALSPKGRFRGHLKRSPDGLLEWAPFPGQASGTEAAIQSGHFATAPAGSPRTKD